MKISVLDKGFVRLIDFMGSDNAVVEAARVSYGKGAKTPEEDKKLIKYLLAHKHGSPFEHTSFKFHVKCPIFVMRQWIRHRIGCSYNEISARYTEVKEDFYLPTKWRKQDAKNKQGSFSEFESSEAYMEVQDICGRAHTSYQKLLSWGIAREMARMVLPINLYTEFYWTTNARALMHFLDLRADEHAQFEIREYANALKVIFKKKMPRTAEAYGSK